VREHESLKSWLIDHLAQTTKTCVRIMTEAVLVITIQTSVWTVSEVKRHLTNPEGARPRYRAGHTKMPAPGPPVQKKGKLQRPKKSLR